VYVAVLRRADHSSKESYRLYKKDYETEEEAKALQMAVGPLMNEKHEHSNPLSSLYCLKFNDFTDRIISSKPTPTRLISHTIKFIYEY
jgi:hypothetical protein